MHETMPCDQGSPPNSEFDATSPDLWRQGEVSFTSGPEAAPDYEHLSDIAQNADSGATLLVEVLVQLGRLEPLHAIAAQRASYETAARQRETLTDKHLRGEALDDSETAQLAISTDALLAHGPGLQIWHNAETRIKKAFEYYRDVFFGKNEVNATIVDRSELETLYDDTAEYEEISLLTTLRALRSRLPKPRAEIKGRHQPNIGEHNVAEADRVARLLVLEEAGQISFDKT